MQCLGHVTRAHDTYAFIECLNGEGQVYLHKEHVDDLSWPPTCLLRFEVVSVEVAGRCQRQARNARFEMEQRL